MPKEKEYMSKMFRLTKTEEKDIQDKCVDFNKILINNNMIPVKDSELLHAILSLVMKRTKINKDGEIYIE